MEVGQLLKISISLCTVIRALLQGSRRWALQEAFHRVCGLPSGTRSHGWFALTFLSGRRWISLIWSSPLESGCKTEEGGYESLAAGGLVNFEVNFSAVFNAWFDYFIKSLELKFSLSHSATSYNKIGFLWGGTEASGFEHQNLLYISSYRLAYIGNPFWDLQSSMQSAEDLRFEFGNWVSATSSIILIALIGPPMSMPLEKEKGWEQRETWERTAVLEQHEMKIKPLHYVDI